MGRGLGHEAGTPHLSENEERNSWGNETGPEKGKKNGPAQGKKRKEKEKRERKEETGTGLVRTELG